MRIYLASSYSRRDELRAYRDELTRLGHEVTSSWLDTEYQEGADCIAAPPENRARWAEIDYHDVARCDCLIAFTDGKRSRGGRQVEYGMAVALGRRVFVVGPREHIFHYLSSVWQVEDWPALLAIPPFQADAGREEVRPPYQESPYFLIDLDSE